MLGEEPLLPYKRPPLTKEFLRGELPAEELPIEREDWFDDHEVQLRLGTKVTAVDPNHATVTIDGEHTLQGDAIVLATGSEPLLAELKGASRPSVMTMRTLPDSLNIAEQTSADEEALVIGSGFIGCEIAGSLAMCGTKVTLIGEDPLPQLKRLGQDVGARIAGWLEELGVRLIMNTAVRAVRDGRIVELENGTRVRGSCVVLGMGVRPCGALAQTAGLPMRDGAVLVDETMSCTGNRGAVFAVGDVACAYNVSAKRHLQVEHWGDALDHGEIAGCTLAGRQARWEGVPGFWSTIGTRTLKYAAWGDGHDDSRVIVHPEGGFTVWYSQAGVAVGVLTHECDEDYELGSELIRKGAPVP